ncbi:hypothetical protein Nepgr_033541 [Nepenthes gracilis]|uniref:Uncharacterized protein n=1 Tax=Nepenthes gracilis TaxID=150966 RepID=A0AAD3TMS2_NEPGR|nr:hypothetical protein Nepgr_033541 [Nepenthes gracilis]
MLDASSSLRGFEEPSCLKALNHAIKGPRMAEGPLNPPGLFQISISDESVIPRPHVDIISSLPNSHETVMDPLGRLSSVDLVGECNEVLVPKEKVEVKTSSVSSLQYPELLPAVGGPADCSEAGADEEPCSDSFISSACLEVDGSAPGLVAAVLCSLLLETCMGSTRIFEILRCIGSILDWSSCP